MKKKSTKLGKVLFFVFLVLFLLLLICYGALAYVSHNRSLPRLSLYGKNVGNKTPAEIESFVQALKEEMLDRKIIIQISDQEKIAKTYRELGATVNTNAIKQEILSFGKYNSILPTPKYLKDSIIKNANITPRLAWVSVSSTSLSEIFKDKKKDPVNASFTAENNQIKINDEQVGSEINIDKLARDIIATLVKRSYPKIFSATKEIKCDVTKSELERYQGIVSDFVNEGFKLNSDQKTVYPTKNDLLGWLDYERIILEQKLVFSDGQIDSYVNDTLAGKINVKGKSRVISNYDGSVISEGREGVKIDLEKTRNNIKTAVAEGNTEAKIETTVSEITEEKANPDFTPGKYPGKYIEVNLTDQMLYTFEGTNLVGQYKVSTGKWSMPTPQGEFSINDKNPRAYSSTYKLYMPYWMSFIGSQYGIHELPEWPNGAKEGESHLGTPVSHGCVRLGRGSAETVYNWTEIGTIVYIHK